ncbi:MAG: 3-hydroxybutyrate dehydrogenase [Devosia nanyangense]|uniref:3-hydroxybutyrate dehydrogenase n=1 Tax=Devosia nanyangense TaxID=1228055 RepID=A0A933NYA7_9HYPH|nr:3-hydroxybutyrate dehydrogenase [Devosia nanyangense]
MSLAGRTAVVTGSTSGIGLAVAEALAAEGARLVLNSFTDSAADHALAAALAARIGTSAAYVGADMADPAACERLIAEAAARFGSVDILVNNAGIQHVAPIEDFPPDKWNAILAINLSSAFHTIRAAVPAMKAKGWGRIVNIASAHGLIASPYKSAYVAAKHGLVGLTKTVALELAEAGATCNAICPGYVMTPLVEAQIPDQMEAHQMDRDTVIREVMLARQPTRQFVAATEIGATALFLCSDAARQITGTTISVDGGWTAM